LIITGYSEEKDVWSLLLMMGGERGVYSNLNGRLIALASTKLVVRAYDSTLGLVKIIKHRGIVKMTWSMKRFLCCLSPIIDVYIKCNGITEKLHTQKLSS